MTDAYIVNTDPKGQPGEHWLAIWTRNRVCEVFDTYGLPLSTYKNPQLQAWFKQWKEVITDSKIGHYGRLGRLDRCHVTQNKRDHLPSSFCDGMFSPGFSS